MAVQYMRRVIEKKAKFDIMELNCLLVAPKTFIPALFGHANDDNFVQPHHSDLISESYAGDKKVIKFDGDHNSSRPQFFYDSVSHFFYKVLLPPPIPRARTLGKYYWLGDLNIIGSGLNENLLYEILSSLRSGATDAASSSSAPPSISTTASVNKLLSEVASVTAAESMSREDTTNGYDEHRHDEPADVKGELNALAGDCYSYTSSPRESWGRCSSLGGLSDADSYTDCRVDDNGSEIFGTPLGSMREMSFDPKEEVEKDQKKKKAQKVTKKLKSDRFDKLESISRRLRLCILKGSAHRRHKSLDLS